MHENQEIELRSLHRTEEKEGDYEKQFEQIFFPSCNLPAPE